MSKQPSRKRPTERAADGKSEMEAPRSHWRDRIRKQRAADASSVGGTRKSGKPSFASTQDLSREIESVVMDSEIKGPRLERIETTLVYPFPDERQQESADVAKKLHAKVMSRSYRAIPPVSLEVESKQLAVPRKPARISRGNSGEIQAVQSSKEPLVIQAPDLTQRAEERVLIVEGQLRALEKQVADLKGQLRLKQDEIDGLSAQKSAMEGKLNERIVELERDGMRSSRGSLALEQERDSLARDVEAKKHRITEAEDRLSNLERRRDEEQNRANALEVCLKELRGELELLRDNCLKAQRDLVECEKERRTTASQLVASDVARIQLQQSSDESLATARAEIERLTRERAAFEERERALDGRHNAAYNNWRSESESIRQECDRLSQMLRDSQAVVDRDNQEKLLLKAELEQKTCELAGIKSELEQTRKMEAELKDLVSKRESDLSTKSHQLAESTGELEALKMRLTHVEEVGAKAEARISELTKEVGAAHTSVRESQADSRRWLDETARLRAELQGVLLDRSRREKSEGEEMADLTRELNEREALVSALESEKSGLLKRVGELELMLGVSMREASERDVAAQKQLGDLSDQNATLEAAVEKVRGDVSGLESEKSDLLKRVSELEAMLDANVREASEKDAAVQKQLRDLLDQNATLEAAVEKLKGDLSALETGKSGLVKRVSELEVMLDANIREGSEGEAGVQKQLGDQLDQKATWETVVDSLRNDVSVLEAENSVLLNRVSELKVMSDATIGEAAERYELVQKQLGDLLEQRTAWEGVVEGLKGDVSALESEKSGLLKRVGELEVMLDAGAQEASDKCADVQKQLDSLLEQKANLEMTVEDLKSDASARDRREAELEGALGELEGCVRVQTSAATGLVHEIEQLEERLSLLGREVAGNRETILRLSQERDGALASCGHEAGKVLRTFSGVCGAVKDWRGSCTRLRRVIQDSDVLFRLFVREARRRLVERITGWRGRTRSIALIVFLDPGWELHVAGVDTQDEAERLRRNLDTQQRRFLLLQRELEIAQASLLTAERAVHALGSLEREMSAKNSGRPHRELSLNVAECFEIGELLVPIGPNSEQILRERQLGKERCVGACMGDGGLSVELDLGDLIDQVAAARDAIVEQAAFLNSMASGGFCPAADCSIVNICNGLRDWLVQADQVFDKPADFLQRIKCQVESLGKAPRRLTEPVVSGLGCCIEELKGQVLGLQGRIVELESAGRRRVIAVSPKRKPTVGQVSDGLAVAQRERSQPAISVRPSTNRRS